MSPVKRLAILARPHAKYLIGGLVAAGFVSLFDLSIAFALRQFIKMGEADPAAARRLLIDLCLLVIFIYSGKWFFSYQQSVLLSAGIFRIAMDLRQRLYNHLHSLSLSFFDRQRSGQIMSRMTNDVNVIQSASPLFVEVVSGPVKGIGGLIGMAVLSWRLTLASIVVVPIMAVVIASIGGKMRSLTSILQMRIADITELMEQTISGMRIIKSFATEDFEIERFAKHNKEGYRAAMRGAKRTAALSPTVELVGAFGSIIILLYGGWLVSQGQLSWENLGAFVFLMTTVAASARMVGRINVHYQTMTAAAERIFEILDDVPDIVEPPDAVDPGKVRGEVSFRDVSFAYATGTQALSDVDFGVAPGEIVALVGPSGSGKSTIAQLIPRFYDPQKGQVLIDGRDVKTLQLAALRRQISIVPQETMLFATSIRENIAYGCRDASMEQIEEAARAANAHDFILRTPEGYDTVLGERGSRISQGQRQRIAIARAILADPAILILDEATSSLDAESERLVQEALEKLMQGRTTLIIAHRLVTITKAHRILVMEKGRIIESGSFEQLLSGDTMFRKLYEIQHRMAEVAADEG